MPDVGLTTVTGDATREPRGGAEPTGSGERELKSDRMRTPESVPVRMRSDRVTRVGLEEAGRDDAAGREAAYGTPPHAGAYTSPVV